MWISLHLNMSLIDFKEGDYYGAANFAEKAIEREQTAKGYFRLGNAMHALAEYKEAITAFKKGLELEPTSVGIKKALRESLKINKKINNNHGQQYKRAGGYFIKIKYPAVEPYAGRGYFCY